MFICNHCTSEKNCQKITSYNQHVLQLLVNPLLIPGFTIVRRPVISANSSHTGLYIDALDVNSIYTRLISSARIKAIWLPYQERSWKALNPANIVSFVKQKVVFEFLWQLASIKRIIEHIQIWILKAVNWQMINVLMLFHASKYALTTGSQNSVVLKDTIS